MYHTIQNNQHLPTKIYIWHILCHWFKCTTHTHTNYPNLPTMIYTWNSLCYIFKCTTHKHKLPASVNKGLDLQHSMIYCNLASGITFEKLHCKLQSPTCHYFSTQDSETALQSSTCYSSTSTTQNNVLIYKPNLCKLNLLSVTILPFIDSEFYS